MKNFNYQIMTIIRVLGISISLVFGLFQDTFGQHSMHAASFEGNGANGSFFASVGQVSVTPISDNSGSVLPGVQNPYWFNPAVGGSIGTDQVLCAGTAPDGLTSVQSASGAVRPIEYQWQRSENLPTSGFADLSGETSLQLSNPQVSDQAWFRRLARISGKTNWVDATPSNTVVLSTAWEKFRTSGSGSWVQNATWEAFDGTSWIGSPVYPGEQQHNCPDPEASILAGHEIEVIQGSSIALPVLRVANGGKLIIRYGGLLQIASELRLEDSSAESIRIE